MNKLSSRTLKQLAILVKRLEKDRRYMAWVLASYQQQEKLSDNKLLERLQISHKMLLRLALCAYPVTESLEFHDQIRQISSYTNISGSLVANIIRQVESLSALSHQPSSYITDKSVIESSGLFAAARDSDEAADVDRRPPTDNEQGDEGSNAA